MSPRLVAAAIAAGLVAGAGAAVVAKEIAQGQEQHVSMLAMKFDYLPDEVTVKKGMPVALELSALDRVHGFDAPSLGLHAEIPPGAPTVLHFTPEKAGSYGIHCDIFCGDGHEGMLARIIVTD